MPEASKSGETSAKRAPFPDKGKEKEKPAETETGKEFSVHTTDPVKSIQYNTLPEVFSLTNTSLPEEILKSLPTTTTVRPEAPTVNLNTTKSTSVSSPSPPHPTIPFSKPADLPATEVPIRKTNDKIISPTQDLELGKWVIYNNTTNTTCIIAEMAMQLNITYPKTGGERENTTINVPGKSSVANGTCSNSSQSMTITWGPGHSLQINFGINETAKDFYVSGLSLNVNASVFKNISSNETFINYTNRIPEFYTPLRMSYKCDKPQQVNLTSSHPGKYPAVLTLSNTRFEAYMNASKPDFGAAQDCDVFDTPDIVPIAVGVALAILVLVVLVAYLIGRKRSQNRGYLSM